MFEIRDDLLLLDETICLEDLSLDVEECILEECSKSYDIFDDFDFRLYDFENVYEETCVKDLIEIQDSFMRYVKKEEKIMFGKSFVEQFFIRYKCPIEDIIHKSRTELWLENTIYGLQFQAFLCATLNISLPLVPLRHRKTQSKYKKKKEKYEDHILEHCIKLCDYYPPCDFMVKRLAPRNQISLLVFILDILNHPYFQNCVRWKEKSTLTFEIIKPKAVAYFWMMVKGNEMCSFENFTRAIRFKRNAGMFKHMNNKKRRVYQFQQRSVREYKMKRHSNKLSIVLIKILGEV